MKITFWWSLLLDIFFSIRVEISLVKVIYKILHVFFGHFIFVLEHLFFSQRHWKKQASPCKVSWFKWIKQTVDSTLNIWTHTQNDSHVWVNTSNIQKCIKLNHVIYSAAVKQQIALENMLKNKGVTSATHSQSSFTLSGRDSASMWNALALACTWAGALLSSHLAQVGLKMLHHRGPGLHSPTWNWIQLRQSGVIRL